MRNTQYLLGLLLLVATATEFLGGAQALEEGQQCRDDTECDSVTTLMSCKPYAGYPSNVKACQCPGTTNTSFFDKVTSICRIKLGQSCDKSSDQGMVLDCTPNADCHVRNSTCICRNSYYATESLTCVKEYNSDCQSDTECDQHLYQQCISNGASSYSTCGCNPVVSTYDSNEKQCVLLAGQSCSRFYDKGDQNCSKWSTCKEGLASEGDIKEKCRCDDGLVVSSSDGQCKARLEEPCDENGVDNAPCDTKRFHSCVSNVCTCHPNYSLIKQVVDNVTIAAECKGNLEAACSLSSDCNQVGGSLDCVQGKCECLIPAEQRYDAIAKKCYAKLGGQCNTTSLDDGQIPLLCDQLLTCRANEDETQVGLYDGICSGAVGLKIANFSWILLATGVSIFVSFSE